MGDLLRFPKRKTRVQEIDEALERVRCERAKAHARWRELDNEVHALHLERYAAVEAERK